jgi:ABC-type multidrug transport system fused ATPase/permease subunit
VEIFGVAISIGVLTAFISYLSQFFRPFMMFTQVQQILEGAYAASDRILSLLEEQVEIADIDHPKSIENISDGEIIFEDVSFGYRFEGNNNNNKKKISEPLTLPSFLGKNEGPAKREMILNISKALENILKNQMTFKESSTGSRTGGGTGMMGGGPNVSAKQMARQLAQLDIPKEISKGFSNLVKEAIKEQRNILEHRASKGYVLKNINLKIHAGKTFAIVGETGAGKTTMIKLICRFYDIIDGSIKIDGLDIRDLKKDDLRRIIGLVPQDTFIFTGSIKENLLYAVENPTDEIEKKMIDVSKFLGLHNFIETLPEKYETILIENGSNISIGQRQLIAFARALITDPTILVLDEATSSVDPYTETLIQDALDKAREGRTTIIIAHRLSTIKNADQIIVLDNETNNIVEYGTHDELLAKNGKYKRLLQMQHKDISIET